MVILLPLLLPLLQADPAAASDLAAARELFERNVRAIQERDREAYLACYLAGPDLVRTGPEGIADGFAPLAEGTPATGSEDWPASLEARDLELRRLRPGVVYGTYRYRAVIDGLVRSGLSERVFLETDGGWRIAVSTALDAAGEVAAPPLALVGANVHLVPGEEPLLDGTLLLRDGRVEQAGPRSEVEVGEEYDVVELEGRWVVPGLVDTHVHFSQTGWADGRPDALDLRLEYPYEEVQLALERHPERLQRALVAAGVTTVLDCGGYPWTLGLQDASVPTHDAPRVLACGPLIATWRPHQLRRAGQEQFLVPEHERDARELVRALAAQGASAIKFWWVVRDPERFEEQAAWLAAVGQEAADLGLPLVVHATGLEAARRAVEAGARLLVHSVDDAPVDEAFVAAALASGVAYCPTLTVVDGYLHLARRELTPELESQLEQVSPWVAGRVALTPTTALSRRDDARRLALLELQVAGQRERMDENLARLHAAGVPVVLGTDAGNPLTLHGPSVFVELEAMRSAGLTDADVLAAATIRAATALGLEDAGHLRPGAAADLVVLTEDPARDVSALRRATHVGRAGWLHPRGALMQR